MAISESAVSEMEAAVALDSILLKDEIWDDCALGPSSNWSPVLQTVGAFILTLTHPAAIFWGSDLVMIYNEAWAGISRGTLKQGKPQVKNYSEETVEALQAYMKGRISRSIASHEIFDQESKDSRDHPVMCSPVKDADEVAGVVVQVFYKRTMTVPEKSTSQSEEVGQAGGSSDDSAKDGPHEETALDRQPFFQKFAEMLPTGLAILNHKAEPLFVNHQFFELTAHKGSDQSFKMWPETIHDDDYDKVMDDYHRAFESQDDLCTEFRASGEGLENEWRMFLMRPLGNNNLQQWTLRHFGGFICALVDITSIKNAEIAQTKAAKEASERKEQQERFIDMISHEIRNPLSAVIHCTEDILEAVKNGEAKSDTIPVGDIVESARTIAGLCVTHQKNLVDDILSFSKLDASMLSLAPRVTRPKIQMADTLKIFQPELRKQKIRFEYSIDQSYQKTNVDWVMADLVRISQVLVNLMTNAIKFTSKKDSNKTISVEVAASIERPASYPPNVVFFEADDTGLKSDATNNSEWGDREPLHIMVAVKDTGIGISQENQARLFERFRQATPRTGQVYGGSGLGLNIARKLCQLHGGEIGVSSDEGSGSTFGFFFRVRRSDEPGDADKLERSEISARLQTAGHKKPSQVDDKDVPQHLKDVSNEGSSKKTPPADREQRTAAIAEDLRTRPSRSKSPEANKDKKPATEKDDSTGEHKPPEAREAQKISEPSKPDDGKEISSSSRPKILFVEDNLVNQKLLKRKIESKGFDVTTADNGRQAVDIVQAEANDGRKFDCILMDKEMPILDGNAAAREIRTLERKHSLQPTNIIGVTGNVRDELQKDMTDAGMDDAISKPFKMDELIDKMRKGSISK